MTLSNDGTFTRHIVSAECWQNGEWGQENKHDDTPQAANFDLSEWEAFASSGPRDGGFAATRVDHDVQDECDFAEQPEYDIDAMH